MLESHLSADMAQMGFRTRVRLPSGPFEREVAMLPLSQIEYMVLDVSEILFGHWAYGPVDHV